MYLRRITSTPEKRLYTFVGLCALVFAVSVGVAPDSAREAFFGTTPVAGAHVEGPGDLRGDMETQFWVNRIEKVGGKKAYEELSTILRRDAMTFDHARAHDFGAALYEAEGLKGVTVCDNQFTYGCFHEFLGRAIGAHGLPVVAELDQECMGLDTKMSQTGCQHGTGHGVLAAIGYTDADLHKGLEACDVLPYIDPLGGCYSGVFMEYNLQSMLGDDAVIRPIPEGDYYSPCNEVLEKYRKTCIFLLPQWWTSTDFNDQDYDDYTRMGALCRAIDDEELWKTCFEALGTIAASSDFYRPRITQARCEAVSADPRERLLCKGFAAFVLGFHVGPPAGKAVCEGLAGNSRDYCYEYALVRASLVNPIALPQPL